MIVVEVGSALVGGNRNLILGRQFDDFGIEKMGDERRRLVVV